MSFSTWAAATADSSSWLSKRPSIRKSRIDVPNSYRASLPLIEGDYYYDAMRRMRHVKWVNVVMSRDGIAKETERVVTMTIIGIMDTL
jgi:hypothetical protein